MPFDDAVVVEAGGPAFVVQLVVGVATQAEVFGVGQAAAGMRAQVHDLELIAGPVTAWGGAATIAEMTV